MRSHQDNGAGTSVDASAGAADEGPAAAGIAGSMWVVQSNGPNRATTIAFVSQMSAEPRAALTNEPERTASEWALRMIWSTASSVSLPDGTEMTFFDLRDLLA